MTTHTTIEIFEWESDITDDYIDEIIYEYIED
jgi:hypothetical protein